MALTTTLVDIQPFLVKPLTSAQQLQVSAWLPVLDLYLNRRYGAAITEVRKPAFYSAIADAVQERLNRPGQVLQQSIGPASVRYADSAALLRWFSPEQLAELDALCYVGGASFVRTPAPDGIRYGNLVRDVESDDESGEGDGALPAW